MCFVGCSEYFCIPAVPFFDDYCELAEDVGFKKGLLYSKISRLKGFWNSLDAIKVCYNWNIFRKMWCQYDINFNSGYIMSSNLDDSEWNLIIIINTNAVARSDPSTRQLKCTLVNILFNDIFHKFSNNILNPFSVMCRG